MEIEEIKESEIANTSAAICGCTLVSFKRAFPDVDERLLTEIFTRIFQKLSNAEPQAQPEPVITPARPFPRIEFRHPVHHEWTEADFERLWRFDENRDMTRSIDDWSHPAHTKSVIPPPSQTVVVWREMGLHGDERHLYFHHLNNNAKLTDIPCVLRCEEPGYLSLGSTREDVCTEIDNGRECVRALVEMYEQDWQTQAERENLLRQLRIKKSKRPDFQSGERIRTCLTERFEENLGLPPLKEDRRFRIAEFSLPEFEKLRAEWEEKLRRHNLQEIEIELPPKAQRQEWPENDEDIGDTFEGLRITNDGVRETTSLIPERKDEFPKWQKLVNPDDLSLEEWEEPRTDEEKEQFAILAAKNLTMFHNVPLEEAAAQVGLEIGPNALSKRFARIGRKKPGINWKRTADHYFCIANLNGRQELKILALVGTPFNKVCDAFVAAKMRSKLSAIKREKRKGKKNLKSRMEEATDRILQAYGKAFILFADENGGTEADHDMWLGFNSFEVEVGTDVTHFPTSRGETYGE